ncbi:unnamed protein product, partial [Ilex paraguariensis]
RSKWNSWRVPWPEALCFPRAEGEVNSLIQQVTDDYGLEVSVGLPQPTAIGSEDQIVDVVGITEEVLAFARNIAHHPETWLDFLLSEEKDINGMR